MALVLVTIGCDHAAQEKVSTMSYKPMAELFDLAGRADPDLPTGSALSYPIPVRSGERVLVAVFRYQAGYDPATRTNVRTTPEHVAFFDAATGKLVREETRPPGTALGSERFNVPRAEYRALLAEMFAAYDALLPAFARGEANVGPETSAAARTYKVDFARVAGTLLVPHYYAIGGEWFTWVDAVAAQGGAL